jgi:hypothetical protein
MRAVSGEWYNTEVSTPWQGSHLYQTLNAADGILPLIEATDIGAYLFAGPNGNGMRTYMPIMMPGTSTATGYGYRDRGRLFLPTECEVWGLPVQQTDVNHFMLPGQWPIFAGTLRHVAKNRGDGGYITSWWMSTFINGTTATRVGSLVSPTAIADTSAVSVAPCFLIT